MTLDEKSVSFLLCRGVNVESAAAMGLLWCLAVYGYGFLFWSNRQEFICLSTETIKSKK